VRHDAPLGEFSVIPSRIIVFSDRSR